MPIVGIRPWSLGMTQIPSSALVAHLLRLKRNGITRSPLKRKLLTLMKTGFTHERSYQGETNVWLTPKYIIDTLGPFDLDPCAAPEPRPWETAKNNFVKSDDGLLKIWSGFVWLNPPYGPETGIWLDKLGNHNNGIALVFARTDTRWFQNIARIASLLFFPAGRIHFYKPDGSKGRAAPTAPSVFIAFGQQARDRLIASDMDGVFHINMR